MLLQLQDEKLDPNSLPTPGNDFLPGTVLGGSYRIIRLLARGGMGEIHLASHERLPGNWVVKVLAPDVTNDPEAFARFWQEATVMATIHHPNVVQLIDFNISLGGKPYLVMEYLPGNDLAEVLKVQPFLPYSYMSSIIKQIACALTAAHKQGIIHRDLKPENIMIVPCDVQGFSVKVIDFGISKICQPNHSVTDSVLLGTPSFISPEQVSGKTHEVGPASDQFSLAVISYLMIAGRVPWAAKNQIGILQNIIDMEPLPLNKGKKWHQVERVLLKGMEKSHEKRYSSVLLFWQELHKALVNSGLLLQCSFESTLPTVVDFAQIPYLTMTRVSNINPQHRGQEPASEYLKDSGESVELTTHPMKKITKKRQVNLFLMALFVSIVVSGFYLHLGGKNLPAPSAEWVNKNNIAIKIVQSVVLLGSDLLGIIRQTKQKWLIN